MSTKSNEPWGKSFSTPKQKDFFIQEFATNRWWVTAKVVSPLGMMTVSEIMVSEGKRYIPYDEVLSTLTGESRDSLIAMRVQCEAMQP